jgi:hypothetical protein
MACHFLYKKLICIESGNQWYSRIGIPTLKHLEMAIRVNEKEKLNMEFLAKWILILIQCIKYWGYETFFLVFWVFSLPFFFISIKIFEENPNFIQNLDPNNLIRLFQIISRQPKSYHKTHYVNKQLKHNWQRLHLHQFY